MAELTTVDKTPRKRRRSAGRLVLFIVIVLILAAGGWYLWKYLNTYESTDDAQIDGHINAISARIGGHVTDVLVEDERYVKAGDVLVRIDPSDYEVAVAKAEADLADAEAALQGSRIDIPITAVDTSSQLKTAHSTRADAGAAVRGAQRQLDAAQARLVTAQAQVREAEATYKNRADDVARYKLLVDKDEISRQQYDTSVSAADAAKATLDARRASVAEAEQNIRFAQAGVDQADEKIPQAEASVQTAMTGPEQVAVSQAKAKSATAQVAQRKALLEQAKLNLAYCTIVAPVTGIVGKKTVELGQNISPGQQLMAVVPLDDIWVTANFKETQLTHMRPGQYAKIKVDTYGGKTWDARVTDLGGATGAKFSLLPPENATGNYVKVVQRIPVRIDFDGHGNPDFNKDGKLRPGMSVEPDVKVR